MPIPRITRLIAPLAGFLLAGCLAAQSAKPMTHTLVMRFDAEPPPSGATVGVMSNGVASTSIALAPVSGDGLYRVTVAVQYGSQIQVQLLHAGLLSSPSNVQVFERCYWERTNDGVVGASDWSEYLVAMGAGTATAAEEESFVRAFGMYCPEP